jgi:hypothetical protein
MGTDGQAHRPAAARRLLLCLATGVLALLAAGCGSSSTSAPAPAAASENLLSSKEIAKYPPDSVQRSFLNYWSDLQYRSWADAAAYYDPRFRNFVGTASVIGAKKGAASVFPLVKPQIERVNSAGGNTTVYYTLVLPEGTKELDSITWVKKGGNWQIIYDSRLDSELGQLATNQAEVKKTGSVPTGAGPASPEAVRAGKAAESEQARFLQEQLKTSAP